MVGNVREWCRDRYGLYKLQVRAKDGLRMAPATSRNRVYRGGSFSYTAALSRVANRSRNSQAFRNYALGLRPALGTTK